MKNEEYNCPRCGTVVKTPDLGFYHCCPECNLLKIKEKNWFELWFSINDKCYTLYWKDDYQYIRLFTDDTSEVIYETNDIPFDIDRNRLEKLLLLI